MFLPFITITALSSEDIIDVDIAVEDLVVKNISTFETKQVEQSLYWETMIWNPGSSWPWSPDAPPPAEYCRSQGFLHQDYHHCQSHHDHDHQDPNESHDKQWHPGWCQLCSGRDGPWISPHLRQRFHVAWGWRTTSSSSSSMATAHHHHCPHSFIFWLYIWL